MIIKLAFKNLFLQKKRYTLMTIAVATGFLLITILSALSQGAIDTIRLKAARYFSGQICVYGLNGDFRDVENPDYYVDLLRTSKLPIEKVSKRSILYDDSEGMLYFNGSYVTMRKIIGVDFETEKKQLSKLPFIEGGIGDGILISRAITDDLGANVGDNITLSITTRNGQANTITLPISGIFDELNIFGYSIYVDREKVNTLANYPAEYVSEIAVYTKKGANITKTQENIRQILLQEANVLPPILTRDEFTKSLHSVPTGERAFAVVSIDTQLAQITMLLNAFEICTYFVLIIFMLITAIGIINTYRVIIHNRTNEIGTMRALGIQKTTIIKIFLTEAVILSIVASLIGFIIAVMALPITQLFEFTITPAINMFTEFGKLQYTVKLNSMILHLILITISIVLAVLEPSKKAATISPADALRTI